MHSSRLYSEERRPGESLGTTEPLVSDLSVGKPVVLQSTGIGVSSKSMATYASFSLISPPISRSVVVVKEYPHAP